MDQDKSNLVGELGTRCRRRSGSYPKFRMEWYPQTIWYYKDVGHTQRSQERTDRNYVPYANAMKTFPNSVKPTRLIQQILLMGTIADTEDIVLDFFAGSATTGHAVFDTE